MVVTGNPQDYVPDPTPASPEVTPYTPANANTGKQQHGNVQIALAVGGNLQATPGAVLP